MARTYRVMRRWARLPKRMGAGSVPAEAIGRAVYAIPRAELWKKTDNFQTKSEVRGRVTCVFPWRILLFVFFVGLLAVPLPRHES